MPTILLPKCFLVRRCCRSGYKMASSLLSTGANEVSSSESLTSVSATETKESSSTEDPASVNVLNNLDLVRQKISAACKVHSIPEPRLVAVSKTKPLDLILQAYAAGQHVFGENYVQELEVKAADSRIPDDLQWHFIGRLQSNKCNTLARIRNLAVVETVSSEKLARHLNRSFRNHETPLRVFIQVNTSGEENKAGIEPEKCEELASVIYNECDHLKLAGLMTIGLLDRSIKPDDDNIDFHTLLDVRERVAASLGVEPSFFELSMGMSSDFEQAISLGSTNVRVGSNIFGARINK
eukprot:gene10954-3026_t